jgi:hypothetical protein
MRLYNNCIAIVGLTVLLCSTSLPGATSSEEDFLIGTGVSGSWYTASRSGEGFFIEALDDNGVLIYWFTYSAESASQAWLVGTGTLSENILHIPEMYITSGPSFGKDYDPEELTLEIWGELSIRFDSCDSAELSYESVDGNAVRSITRLTGVLGTNCSSEPNRFSHRSGSWFNSTRNGEGWILQQFADNDFLVAWFTYNSDGEQAWMTGTTRVNNEQLSFLDLVITHGTRFGDGFDPLDVVRESWGDTHFLFSNCDAGIADYEARMAPFGKARQTFERLTSINGVNCDIANPLTIDQGTWLQLSMPFTRLGARSASIDGLIYLSGGFQQATRFDSYEPQSNTWQRLADVPDQGRTRHAAVAHEGEFYVFGGIKGGNWTTVGDTSAFQYSPETDTWTNIASLPASLHTGAAVSAGNSIYIHAGHRGDFWRFDPSTQEYVSLPNVGVRIGARLILFKGEIWLIGGYNSLTDLRDVKIFNLLDESWRDGPLLADLRAGFAAQVLDGQIITVGGEVTINTAPRLIEQVEILASEEMGWVPGTSPVFPVYDSASAVMDGRLYIFGGGNVANTLNRTNHLQIYTPAAD